MSKHGSSWFHRRAWATVLIGLLAWAFVLPVPLRADKKKADAAPAGNPGDQRVTAYFDISKIVWPSPPEIARIRFVDLFTGEKIDPTKFEAKKKKKSWMDRMAGTTPTDQIKIDTLPFQLIRTYGLAVDSKGKIYAADQAVGAVFIFDLEHKDQVELIGNGKQANFAEIVGLAMDDNDRLFVTDAKLRHVLVFNAKHEQEAMFGADVLVRPGGIAIDTENRLVYVVDAGNDCVQVFDADTLKLLRHIGKPSKRHDQTDPGTFSLPTAVALDDDRNVYVTDTFNNRVEIFDADGNFISTFGKNGDSPADLGRPKCIAIDSDGHVWVVDAFQNRVKVFSQQGRLLIYFGDQGHFPGQFMGPWGIAIDKQNRVLVSETYPGRVQVFRYVTDAEAAAEKAKSESQENQKSSRVSAPKAPTEPAPTANAGKPAN